MPPVAFSDIPLVTATKVNLQLRIKEYKPANKPDAANQPATVRRAIVDDAVSLRSLRLEALLNKPEAFGGDYEIEQKDTVSDWETGLKDQADGAIFVAVAEQSLVGMMGIAFQGSAKVKHNGKIWGAYVQLNWRGRGISKLLVEA